MTSALGDTGAALKAFTLVAGVLPLRALGPEAVQVDVRVTRGALSMRKVAFADYASPIHRVGRQIQLPSALQRLSCLSVRWRTRTGRPWRRVVRWRAAEKLRS